MDFDILLYNYLGLLNFLEKFERFSLQSGSIQFEKFVVPNRIAFRLLIRC